MLLAKKATYLIPSVQQYSISSYNPLLTTTGENASCRISYKTIVFSNHKTIALSHNPTVMFCLSCDGN